LYGVVCNFDDRKVGMREGHGRAGICVANLDDSLELRSKGLNDTGPQALARKLLIALWRFVIDGVVPEGVIMKPSI
jgi:hypothetical protein